MIHANRGKLPDSDITIETDASFKVPLLPAKRQNSRSSVKSGERFLLFTGSRREMTVLSLVSLH